ncbi:hypothetical protein CASFOL_038711 [Castilleja foliolosa]|uniref:Uncharacterized protein n=1 Tax=Castilleja foliolosa TaxID=1961234 RepID=A0ABD3BLR2_9LAMI
MKSMLRVVILLFLVLLCRVRMELRQEYARNKFLQDLMYVLWIFVINFASNK